MVPVQWNRKTSMNRVFLSSTNKQALVCAFGYFKIQPHQHFFYLFVSLYHSCNNLNSLVLKRSYSLFSDVIYVRVRNERGSPFLCRDQSRVGLRGETLWKSIRNRDALRRLVRALFAYISFLQYYKFKTVTFRKLASVFKS